MGDALQAEELGEGFELSVGFGEQLQEVFGGEAEEASVALGELDEVLVEMFFADVCPQGVLSEFHAEIREGEELDVGLLGGAFEDIGRDFIE